MSKIRKRIIPILLAVFLLGLVIFFNEFSLTYWRGIGPIKNSTSRLILAAVDAGLVVLAALILRHRNVGVKNIILLVFSVILSLCLFFVLCETHTYFSLITKHHMGWRPMERSDPVLAWSLIPSTTSYVYDEHEKALIKYVIDADGCRHVVREGNARNHVHVFGDSYTFGERITQGKTYPEILSREYLPRDMHVHNHGVNGYGILQMYGSFLNIASKLLPGDVVVFSPISHDFSRNYGNYQYNMMFMLKGQVDHYPVLDHEKVIGKKIGNWYKLKGIALASPVIGELMASARSLLQSLTGSGDKDFEDSIEAVKRAKEITEAKGARFILVLLPSRIEVEERKYICWIDKKKLHYLDLRDRFPYEKSEIGDYFLYEGHYSETANRKVASEIAAIIQSNDHANELWS